MSLCLHEKGLDDWKALGRKEHQNNRFAIQMMKCKVIDTMEERLEVIAHPSVGASPWTVMSLAPTPSHPCLVILPSSSLTREWVRII